VVVALDVSLTGHFFTADEGLDGGAGFLRRGPMVNISTKNNQLTNYTVHNTQYLY